MAAPTTKYPKSDRLRELREQAHENRAKHNKPAPKNAVAKNAAKAMRRRRSS